MEACVAAIVVTFRREPELRRLLQSLSQSTRKITASIVVDNAADEEARRVVEEAGATWLPAENLGPGAGWKAGMEHALKLLPQVTHFLVLDDDVVIPPEAVEKMLHVALERHAAMVAPMLLDAAGQVWGFPEPLEPSLRQAIRQVKTAAESPRLLGEQPQEFAWCTGACVLVSAEAVQRAGLHRTDFWMLGEDLEFSMRMSAAGGGFFLPDVFVPHLPPLATNATATRRADLVKFCSLLQNLTYLSFHHPGSRHLKSYLPGNLRRFFQTHGWWHAGAALASVAFGLLGQPAGANWGRHLRERLQRLPST